MGVDFAAILAHPFDNSNILTVADLLNADQDVLGKAISQLRDFMKKEGYFVSEEETQWHWECSTEWDGNNPDDVWSEDNGKYIQLRGPGSIHISFGRQTCDLDTRFKWMRFHIDPVCRAIVRSVTYGIAQAFSGSKAIYLPDSGSDESLAFDFVREGASLQQIEEWLLQNHGEPAPLLEGVNYFEFNYGEYVGSYFIDDFTDFKLES